MERRRSSIFSFDTARPRSIPGSWWATLGLTAGLLAAAELTARVALAPMGDRLWGYWDEAAAQKFEWYRTRVGQGHAPAILVVGDSTGARNVDVAALGSAAGGLDVYSLAAPANFPLAFRVSTLPLLRMDPRPDHVLLVQLPHSYTDAAEVVENERGILTSAVARQERGEILATDYLHLARLYPARRLLARYWVHGAVLVQEPPCGGFMPLDSTSAGPDRARDGTSAVPSFSPERRAVLLELAALTRARRQNLVVVLPPLRERPLPPVLEAHRDWLLQNASVHGFAVWDYSQASFLPDDLFKDNTHLSPEGAARLGAALGARLRPSSPGSRDGR